MHPITQALLAWYSINARKLPWRSQPNPYYILVSELMLQQTRVETVLPYFQRFISRFPTLKNLAQASQQDVLAVWEGLGYYSRARNLHKTAQLLLSEHGGRLPKDPAHLADLPGIGPYTAAAIASIVYNAQEPALDANLRRVLARLTGSQEALGSSASNKVLLAFVSQLIPAERPGDFNQAFMDLGAMICLPKAPTCISCPIQAWCQAYALGLQDKLPLRPKKASLPLVTVGAAIIRLDSLVLIARRPQKGLLAGLWEFPGGKLEPQDADIQACIRREIMEELQLKVTPYQFFGSYCHTYTHFKLSLEAWFCRLDARQTIPERSNLAVVKPLDLENYPMGKVDRQISRELAQEPWASS